jgi:DNA modification methylase
MGRDELSEGYEDDQETYRNLTEALCLNLDKIMSISGHLMFWFSPKWEIEKWTRECFARLAPSIGWTRYNLVWLKSDNAGIAASPQYEPRHIYETCLLGSRGKRPIVKIVADAYSCPTDKTLHVSCKPEPMLRHFMQMLVDENTSMLDPTAGSGSALRAAESLGAKRVFGLERDPKMVEMALRALKNERLKRSASRIVAAPQHGVSLI